MNVTVDGPPKGLIRMPLQAALAISNKLHAFQKDKLLIWDTEKNSVVHDGLISAWWKTFPWADGNIESAFAIGNTGHFFRGNQLLVWDVNSHQTYHSGPVAGWWPNFPWS